MPTEMESATVEYLATTRIGEKGQLTVPKPYRDDLGLKLGASFAILRVGDGLILLPQQRRFERLCERLTATLARAGVSSESLLAALPKARERVYARQYGAVAKKPTGRRAPKGPANP